MNIFDLYNDKTNYEVTDFVQQLDFDVDIETLRKEIFSLIVKNNYGTKVVSLRMPKDNLNWIDTNEILESGSVGPFATADVGIKPANELENNSYTEWHPDLKNSYLKSLATDIEKLIGMPIGRVRLGWLQPDSGYPIHADTEPMRIHIPIFTNDLAYIIHSGTLTNMQYGKVYHLITPKTHTAWNFSRLLPRLHLIFSTCPDQKQTELITKISSLSSTEENIRNHLTHTGVDKYSLLQYLKLKDIKPKSDEFNQVSKLIKILEG